MTAAEKCLAHGFEDVILLSGFEEVILLSGYSYDDALIGVTEDGRAVYDYDLMVEWLINEEDMTVEEAEDWINYNTIRALPYAGPSGPIIMHRI